MSHTVKKAGRGGDGLSSSASTVHTRPFGTLDELSLCCSSSHREDRFAEMMFTNPRSSSCPDGEMDRISSERLM